MPLVVVSQQTLIELHRVAPFGVEDYSPHRERAGWFECEISHGTLREVLVYQFHGESYDDTLFRLLRTAKGLQS